MLSLGHKQELAMDKIAEKLAGWFGSTPFILFHVVWFGAWLLLHYTADFDPEWANLTFIVSLEAIFLALFILRAENVQAARFEEQVKRDLKVTKQIQDKLDRRKKA
jgi:uncharacterized membrane protein